ncbi:MAG: hypothetical protein VKO00_10715 [Cyanobacteriota bacterium]|nr:hypothetical protein [Cyanobacteriota bacterium]
MPINTEMQGCIARERGALVFWSTDTADRKPAAKVQIIDVFSLQVTTGYTRDSQGRLLLESQPALAAGRSWSLAKAAQLIRNDVRPHRWVALQQDRRAWGLFWAGGGLQHCRDLLLAQAGEAETAFGPMSSALVPLTPEVLLRVLLDLEAEQPIAGRASRPTRPWRPALAANPWTLVAWTSLAWLAVLGITVASFMAVLERQDRQLELLLERTAPASGALIR